MQRGDVFRLYENEQLYYVDEVSPDGTLYVERYDLYAGWYGAPLVLRNPQVREVLFNLNQAMVTQPDQIYCEIDIEFEFNDPQGWNGYEWFAAKLLNSKSENRIVAKSPPVPFIRGEPMLFHHHPQNQRLHRLLVEELFKQHWQPVLDKRRNWYQWVFRRAG